ncbi:MAG: hypothetical protein HY791_28975 [Deltaproteobacteria bacterium]|nr:hypothetical protein [Deltaproteobacteria bacterium]
MSDQGSERLLDDGPRPIKAYVGVAICAYALVIFAVTFRVLLSFLAAFSPGELVGTLLIAGVGASLWQWGWRWSEGRPARVWMIVSVLPHLLLLAIFVADQVAK